ncbi:MAG: ion transporter [Deltaproteobacteria bacterium]|nr:ion transporter [Deltaproteobacteria bacterium]
MRAVIKFLILSAMAASVASVALETVPSINDFYAPLFRLVEIGAVALLTLEYGLRWWGAPERDPASTTEPWRARLRYALSAFGFIDLTAILPFYVNLFFPIDREWLRVLRLLRLLKFARYVSGLALFVAVVRSEARALVAALLVVVVILVMASGIMFVLEQDAQPTVFASIPHAMWWTIVTIATVGYGDIAPVTPLGKAFGGIVMLLGIAMFAVPAGILAAGFAVEVRKRNFVVTWQTVAKVPLFSGLDAGRIGEIAGMLKRHVVPAHHVIVRRGGPGDAMFFIMAGEVEVDVQPHPIRLGRGQYFGEIALLQDSVRTATVTSLSECQLLALEVADFRRLLEAHPDLKAAIMEVAERRLSGTRALSEAGRDE